MTTIGFVHIPGAELTDAKGGRGAPLILSRLGFIERTAFSEIVVSPADARPNFELAAEILQRTESVRAVVVLPVSDTDPFEAACRLADLDHLSGGRVSVRLDLEQGAHDLDHMEMLQRADEFVVLLKRFWANDQPITFEGSFYRCTDALVPRKGPQGAGIPIWTSGASGSAIQFAGRHANVFQLQPGSLAEVAMLVERVNAARSQFGHRCCPRFVLPVSGAENVTAEALAAYARAGVTAFAVSGLSERSAIASFAFKVASPVAELARRDSAPSEIARQRLSPTASWPAPRIVS